MITDIQPFAAENSDRGVNNQSLEDFNEVTMRAQSFNFDEMFNESFWYNFSGFEANDSMESMADLKNMTVTPNETNWAMTPFSMEHLVVSATLLGMLIVATIIGNVLVIIAIMVDEKLKSVANYLIMSLALTDCAVSICVMPLAVISEVTQVWFLGKAVCEFFISIDVLLCTASILHLVVIALDRYLAVTRIDYMRNRTAKRIKIMILIVWVISVFISIPPLFGWKDPHNNADITGMCIISQDKLYTVYSTGCAFYLPFVIIMVIYYKIWRAARSRIRKKGFRSKSVARHEDDSLVTEMPTEGATLTTYLPGPDSSLLNKQNGDSVQDGVGVIETHKTNGDTMMEKDSSPNGSVSQDSNGNVRSPLSPLSHTSTTPLTMTSPGSPSKPRPSVDFSTSLKSVKLFIKRSPKEKHRDKLEQRRERKAARTLAIITGCFCSCWFPFFVLALITPFCGSACDVPHSFRSVINWLGYSNSLLNPIIYTIFSPDFRNAFRKILKGKFNRRRR